MRGLRPGAISPVMPALGALMLLLVVWGADGAAYAVGTWTPGAVGAVVLLALAVVLVPTSWEAVPVAVRVAVGALAAFTAWSYASTTWADDPGLALEGANRTLLYLAIFALFALWPLGSGAAAGLLGTWAIGVGAIAVWVAGRLWLDPAGVGGLFGDGRLDAPAGYQNAAAALLAMGLWPAVALAGSPRTAWPVRALTAGLAVVLADVALLSLSRGALLATPIVAVVAVVVLPHRLRLLGVLVVVGGLAALAAPAVLDVSDAISGDDAAAGRAALQAAGRGALLAGLAAAVVVGLLAAWEARRPLAEATARRVSRVATVVAVAGAVVGVVGGLAVGGNPGDRLSSAWSSFKGGYADDATASNRLTSGLGSNRYDFYRVALRGFRAAPVLGEGADAFGQLYLRDGRSAETPRYAHSLELRTLVGLGLVGAVLLLVAIAAALVGAWGGLRGAGGLVAGGALLGFLHWAVHGSADWFWEIAGLGAPAWALLGLACALAPRRVAPVDGEGGPAHRPPQPVGRPTPAPARTPGPVGRVVAGVLALAGVVVLVGPWLSARDVRAAAGEFATRPASAYARLDRAAWLDPLSDAPAALEGSIAVRLGDLPRASAAFARALERVPDDEYAVVRLGAVASARGDRSRATALLARAVTLSPRDATAREALGIVRSGGTIDLQALDERTLDAARDLGR